MAEGDQDFMSAFASLQVVVKSSQRYVGCAVLRPRGDNNTNNKDDHKDENGSSSGDIEANGRSSLQWSVELLEFMDDEQLSDLDTFLIQLGPAHIYVSDELEDSNKGLGRKFYNISRADSAQTFSFVKKSLFHGKMSDINSAIERLTRDCADAHNVNTAELEKPLAYASLYPLLSNRGLLNNSDSDGCMKLTFGSLGRYMRLDSAAAEAVNLLPKPDHPSQYGSLVGVLNRCKTKMGERVLQRCLRQPLMDPKEVNFRHDFVGLLKDDSALRSSLVEQALKGLPDMDVVIGRLQRGRAGLAEVYRLYSLTSILPALQSAVCDLSAAASNSSNSSSSSSSCSGDSAPFVKYLQEHFVAPLENLAGKFDLYRKFVEFVVDMDELPALLVSDRHDETLKELKDERRSINGDAERMLEDARCGWASFCDVKLERHSAHGLVFRCANSNDERDLRAANKDVEILSLQKSGVLFSTRRLSALGARLRQLEGEYEEAQAEIVNKAVETARTYVGVAEALSAVIAELDMLASFATVAALSPFPYVRPVMRAKGAGVYKIKAARHPCVELMDAVHFVPNDYEIVRGESHFNIVTGPNMGGKSTFIRTVGCIAIMAQCGAFVPCESAELSFCDAVLARVGAGDAVQKGVSTFMAEMLEAAVILRQATPASLVIIDELGRGTSTFDGYGIAWSISEYLLSKSASMVLFATHFHELTQLATKHTGVANRHVTAHVDPDSSQVVMLYNVEHGPCTRSFGVHVAAMAGFPEDVLTFAKRKSEELEGDLGAEATQQARSRARSAARLFADKQPPSLAEEMKPYLTSLLDGLRGPTRETPTKPIQSA
jgi:DNA mismatch repair protein MSH2